MSDLQDGVERLHVKGWCGDFYVVFCLTEGLTNMSMKPVQVSSAIGGTIHECSIVLDVFIFVLFCVSGKESP